MLDFRFHENLIRNAVKVVDGQDSNWKWGVKSIEETVVYISWTYLDYMLEKKNAFLITYEHDETGEWITCHYPDGRMMDAVTHKANEEAERAIIDAITCIAYRARNEY